MIYTAFADYYATGEGRSLMFLVSRGYGPKSREENVRDRFIELFGSYMAMGMEIKEGLNFDFDGIDLLVSEKTRKFLESSLDAGNLEYHVGLHFNFS